MNLQDSLFLLDKIRQHVIHQPNQIALQDAQQVFSYAQLNGEINALNQYWNNLFQQKMLPTIALAVENHPAWVVLDLVAMRYNIPLVPLPFFFSPTQWLHALQDAGAKVLVTDQPEQFSTLLARYIQHQTTYQLAGKTLTQFTLNLAAISLPEHTAKITYTSGTTGHPKGVCLSIKNMLNVAQSIVTATNLSERDVHLSVLPLATLLENVAGVYACLIAGARCVLLPSHAVGLNGAAGLDVNQLRNALKQTQATTTIFTPELLHALVMNIEAGEVTPSNLRFLAVGGASVSPSLLQRAKQQAIPVFEG